MSHSDTTIRQDVVRDMSTSSSYCIIAHLGIVIDTQEAKAAAIRHDSVNGGIFMQLLLPYTMIIASFCISTCSESQSRCAYSYPYRPNTGHVQWTPTRSIWLLRSLSPLRSRHSRKTSSSPLCQTGAFALLYVLLGDIALSPR